MWSLRCCFCCEDDTEPYLPIVTQNSNDDEVIANQEILTEEEYKSIDSSLREFKTVDDQVIANKEIGIEEYNSVDSSTSEFKTFCKSPENPEDPVSDKNAAFPTGISYCIDINENVRNCFDIGIEKIKILNEKDVQIPEYYWPQNFFSADFSRWLRNDNLYIEPALSYNPDDILKMTECIDDYQEFELYAVKKPSNANSETASNTVTTNTGAKPKLSYAQALKDSMSGPSSVSNSKNVKKKKNRAVNRKQRSTNPVAVMGIHNQCPEEVRTSLNPVSSQNNYDMLNKRGKNLVAVIKPTQNQGPEVFRSNFIPTPSQNNHDMLNKKRNNLVAVVKPTQSEGPDVIRTNFTPTPSQSNHDMLTKRGMNKYMNNVNIIKHINRGYIIHKKVHIPSKNWHAVVDRETDKFCMLCGVIYYDKHIYEENHLSQLQKSIPRILNKGWNVVRELKENTLYHCGICNIVLESEQKVNIHVFNEPHRKKYYQSRDKCTSMMQKMFA